jgi:hypothetical protein
MEEQVYKTIPYGLYNKEGDLRIHEGLFDL